LCAPPPWTHIRETRASTAAQTRPRVCSCRRSPHRRSSGPRCLRRQLRRDACAAPDGCGLRRCKASQVAAQGLLALDRLKKRLEIALAEAAAALALDDLVEQRGPILHRLREDLQHVALVVAIYE